jgi:hypothetical protein
MYFLLGKKLQLHHIMDDILLIDQVSEAIVIAETALMREIGSVIHKMNKKKRGKGNRKKVCARRRIQRSVFDIYRCLGPVYFRRAYTG